MSEQLSLPVLVIGTGNETCGDDAAGPLVARAIASARIPGAEVAAGDLDPVGLIERWKSARAVILIDAMSSGRPAGTTERFEAHAGPLPCGRLHAGSTHNIGISEAIELSRALKTLPGYFVVYGIEGKKFQPGDSVSPAVRAAIKNLARQIISHLRNL